MEYLKEFIEPSEVHEALFVGFLWSDPKLYNTYKVHKIQRNTFTKNIWYDYYYFGKEMSESGIETFDDRTVYSYISSKPKEVNKKSYMDIYNAHGGYDTIQLLINESKIKKSNDEYHFSEIQKYECLRKFQAEGLINTTDLELINRLCSMNIKQLKSYFQYKVNNTFSNVNHGEVVHYKLGQDLDTAIDKMNSGEAMGMPLHDSPRLNKKIKGWKRGELYYLVLSSGVGKSSIAMEKFSLPLYENQVKGAMYTNEENVWKSRNLLLATVASKINKQPINREKLSEGNFDEKTLVKLTNAKEWIKKQGDDLVDFYDLKKYRVEDVINRVNLSSPLNINYHILDTFKPDTSSREEARWEAFGANAQDLFDCIKPEANNVAMLATVQLKIGQEFRYLDLSAIGKSKEIAEVASVVLMGRLLYDDEYTGKNHAINAYNWSESPDPVTGKKFKIPYELEKDKTYMILFIAKNRGGSALEQILYEVRYGINAFIEVAYVEMGKKANPSIGKS